MSTKVIKQSENMFIKCIKAPIRVLTKARDFYVKSVTDCSGRMSYGAVLGPVSTLPKSYSTTSNRSSTDEDLRELIRAASQRGLREKIEKEIQQQRQSSKKLPRSFTVGIARIDEDKPCDDFGDDPKLVKPAFLYPRSRSYAVPKRTTANLYST